MVTVAHAPAGELSSAEAADLPPDDVLARLGSSTDGLSSEDVAERLRQFGPNALGTHRVRAAAVLLRQIRNPILILLLGAALVSGLTGGGTNALIIAVIVALSVGLGFFNEYRAERAMAALRAQIRQEAEVRRDGQQSRVPVMDLVPGDVVSLRIGALVPADLRLLTVDELECDEGVLTGESMPAAKSVTPAGGTSMRRSAGRDDGPAPSTPDRARPRSTPPARTGIGTQISAWADRRPGTTCLREAPLDGSQAGGTPVRA